jgi:hypothetical protein
MIIVCDHDACTIETEATSIPLAPAAGFLPATALVPTQWNRDQQKAEGPSRSVWK